MSRSVRSALHGTAAMLLFASSYAYAQSTERLPDLNSEQYPNIFRAFEEHVDGIEGLVDIDTAPVYSVRGTSSQGTISRLPTVGRDPTLWGEFDTISWPIFMTAADVR
ncbi:MAG: hypothetical protein AAGI92_12000, partial [Pseudomonadota bacterium]